ncbi:MAG: hypothetical protein R3B09_05910 [Nannocystaceae bacterium]
MGVTRTSVLDGLERRATWRSAALALAVAVPSNLALAGYVLPALQARRPEAMDGDFLVMIDLEPLRSVDEIYRIYDLYTPDILDLVRLLYALDFAMPLALAVLLFCLIGALLRALGVKGRGRALLVLPFVSVTFDFVENALSLLLLDRYQSGEVLPTLARAATLATTLKFVALSAVGVTVVALLGRGIVVAARRRLGRRGGA